MTVKHISEIIATKNQSIEEWKCSKCGSKKTKGYLAICPSGRSADHFPKYIFHIREVCSKCEMFRRFCPQSDELIAKFKKPLELATIVLESGEDKPEPQEGGLFE